MAIPAVKDTEFAPRQRQRHTNQQETSIKQAELTLSSKQILWERKIEDGLIL